MEKEITKVIDLLYLAKLDGIEIILNDDKLQLKVPENKKIDKSLLDEIKNNKKSIIDFLSNGNWKVKNVDKDHNRVPRFNRIETPQIPLSFSQERLWFIDQLEGSLQYHSPIVLRLKGKLHIQALANSLQSIVQRHEVLRTIFREQNGIVFQQVKADETNWELNIIDDLFYKKPGAGLHEFVEELIRKPFNLSEDFMLRGALLVLDEQDYLLVITMHHIASDAWSLNIIIKEVVSLYDSYSQELPVQLPPLELQYADYAVWQRNFLQGEIFEQKVQYWKEKLDGVTPLQLPGDFVKPAIRSSRGASIGFSIDKEISDQLHDLSRQQGTTLFITLLSAFNVLLHRYTGQQDICVGTSIGNRPQRELENLVGFFVNTLALRSEVNSDLSFTDLLQQVKITTFGAYSNQEVPFEKVVETVVKERDPSRSPLFQVMLVLHNIPASSQLQLGELNLSAENYEPNTVKFDLTFFITETENGLHGSVRYSTDLYKEETITRMMGHFSNLLSSLVKAPEQKIGLLPMLAVTEQQELLEGFNESSVDYPKEKTIVSLFEEQAGKAPDNAAVVFEKDQLSYRELNERSNQLAHYLVSKGVRAGTLVPVFIDRSTEMLVAIMGILKSGAAYVPIDVDFPHDRISYMLEDTTATIVISSKSSSSHIRELTSSLVDIIEVDEDGAGLNNQPTTNSGSSPAPKDLAYVIYTSGSTGKPKGVMIEHRSLVDYVFGLNEKTKIDQCRSFALVSTIATDLGNTVIFSSLVFGGALHLFSKETVSNAAALHHYFKVNQIDCLKIVPSHWKALSEDEKLLLPNKLLVFGGEALQADMVEDIRLSGSNCQVVNHYGPTETTIGKLLHVVNDNNKYSGAVPIGKPFSNTTIYILSKELQPCPIGVLGQLYIAGDGVASRYLNNEELTKEKFIANPFGKDGPVMYATGDLVKYLPNGDVLFAGRVDDQVKIRGYRVELGEIESVLQQSALVKQAVVLAREDKQGNKRLVAYIVAEDEFDRDEILSYLKEKLPEYMIPALLMELESLPLTANGKVDRKALPDPDASELLSDKYVAPRNEAEEKLAAIWQDVLEVEQVGIHDDFFELGGHSLLAVRLISAIRKAFNVEMPIGDIFDYPTVATLTGQVGKQAGKAVLPAIEIADPRPGKIPLSFSQERLWFIDQLEGSVQYHVPSVLRLKGKLNLDALAATLQEIVNRHEVLRTVFVEEAGVPYQQVKNKDHWKLTVTDGSRYKKDSNGLQQEIQQIIIDPFILSRDYMMRAHVIVLAEGDQVLVFTVHHIASDGWSRSILVKEVVALYKAYDEGFDAALPPLKIQYADFAIWQRNYLQGELLEKKLTYWKEKLEEVAPLQLATDHPRPPVQSSKGAMIGFNIEKPLADRLQDLGKQHGTTIFMTLLAAFKILLHRYSGQEDICVGTPVAGRQQQETEELIGFFVNTLALRSEVNANDAFIKFLEQIKVTTMEAYQHQDIPFEKVVEEVSKVRDLNRSPVFQVMFVLRNTPDVPELPLGETMLTREQYKHTTAQFDLTLFVTETTRGLQCAVEYSTDLFVEATIGKMVTHFSVLLGSIVNHPGQKIGALKMLTDVEEQQLLVEFNNTKVDFPKEKTIVSLFEEQVKRTPATIAAVFENERITYHQLNERANKLAHYLQARGITPGTLVPLCVERSFDMIIGVLAILKAGAAYVPIDPYFPAERVSYILKDTNADLIIGSKKSRPLLPFSDSITVLEIDGADVASISDLQGTNFKVAVAPDHIAYVLYTSGSTGKPKGVKMGGAGLVNLLSWQEKQFTNKHRRVLQFASLNFDVSFQEIFSTLCFGSCLYLVDADRRRDMSELAKDIATQELTHLFIPYIVLKNLVEFIYPIGNHKFSLEEIIVAGEQLKLSEDIRDLMKQTGVKVINQYGPTEAHVVSSYRIDSAYTVSSLPPIGKPIDNMKLYILGDGGEPVPVGVLGELYIGGVQVAQGYLNLPELTRERFLTNRFSNDADCRLYKTGDLARWLPDGNIEYLGRKDDQEKIRGYRVELGEIETVLQQSGWIKQGVVVAKEDSAGNKRLVAYVVPGEDYDKREVFVYLKKKLPEYMIPVLIVEMRSLPLTRNGKVDKKALPDMHANHLVQKEYVAPENDLQKILAEIWQKLLRVERVGIYDNFFELGGHSLLAVKLVSSIRKTLQMDFPLNYIFIYPTIFAIANNLVEKNKHPLRPKVNIKYLVPLKTGGNKIPLYIICGGGGTARRFIKFANMMEEEQPVYALQPIVDSKGVNNMGSIEELASQFIEEIMINNPDGPYALSGHCLGGITAFEMAKQLEAKGKKVHMLAMFDTIIRKRERVERANFNNLYNIPGAVKKVMSKAALKIDFETYLLTRHTRKAIGYKMRSFSALIKKWRRRQDTVNDLEYAGLEIFNESSNEYIEARKNYKITPYNGEILVFYAKERYYFTDVTQNIRFKKFFINDSTKNLWREYASSVSIFEIEGDHSDIFETVHGNKFAMLLQQQLNRPVKR